MIHLINHYVKNPIIIPGRVKLEIHMKISRNIVEYLDILFSQEIRENINFDIWWNYIRDQ